jgi:hypothetical protein
MINGPALEQQDEHGLDEFIADYEQSEAEQARIDAKPDASEVKRAEALAEKMNGSFLWLVNRTQCPHVALKEMVNKEEGEAAFYGLAEKWGGEVPPWMEAVQPYIAAGVYMGVTIAVARDAEAAVIDAAKKAQTEKNHANFKASAEHGDQ